MAIDAYVPAHYLTVDLITNEPPNAAAINEESFGSTVFGALLVAGVSRVITAILELKEAIFAPNLFIVSMVIGELAADLIVKIATGFKPQTPDLLLEITVAQLAIALPITILTNYTLAIAFSAPFAIGSVVMATIASFVALRVAIVAVTVLLLALTGAAALLTG